MATNCLHEVFADVFDSSMHRVSFPFYRSDLDRLGELDGERIFALLRGRGVSDVDLQCLYEYLRELCAGIKQDGATLH